MKKQYSDKYLFFRTIEHPRNPSIQGAGLLHCRNLLKHFLCLAASMRRTAVIEDIPLDNIHNNRHPASPDPRIYYDLDNILCYRKSPTGQMHRLNYILEQDFDMCRFAPEDIVYLRMEYSQNEEDVKEKYQSIIDKTHAWHYNHPLFILEGYIHDTFPFWFLPMLETVPRSKRCRVSLPWSRNAYNIATDTIRKLCADHKSFDNNYWVIHARRGDGADAKRERFNRWNALSTPSNIRANLKRIKGVNRNTTIYLMSNETDPAYYNALKAIHPGIRTYHDFPKLKALIHSDRNHTPNNYLLFAVERIIWDNASQRITNRRLDKGLKAFSLEGVSLGYLVIRVPHKLNNALNKIRHQTRMMGRALTSS
jgi:hypothetical protein